MTPQKAARILDIAMLDGLTADQVQRAFSIAVKKAHPDTAAGVEGAYTVAEVKRARDVLGKHVATQAALEPCSKCDGEGVIPLRRGTVRRCTACDGDGVVRKRN